AELVLASYAEGVSDEFIKPIAVGDDAIIDGDSLIFFNFRPDRARELARAFIDPEFESYGFARPLTPKIRFVCMTEYDPAFEQRFGAGVVFAKEFPANTLADYFASLGLRQLHIAETEKYAHVTFFFNGGIEKPKRGEERILIPSPRVATYDLQPEMSAPEVSHALAQAIRDERADVYILNFANGDMVGHTGSMEAAVKALEAVDAGLSEVLEALEARHGVALITADHGNAEQMQDVEGNPWTAHTTSRVPLAIVDTTRGDTAQAPRSVKRLDDARLADIAPTLLDLMGLAIPREFTGRSLLRETEENC
ncbi:MAG: 2,3-bisphosphoglycerate-independent phosphoglycerate mutase, partial [Coriobacteriales bacterium]|nr:2,3-bisphosphoglycerate-independent phosphoglycerate mutase [Coriobacteriales bacterium]